ncbi:MAG TPA: hypoxanthine phosphoribosyltransferase [Desulfohalobiaceae bacterium]|nr:hypoxanthine phosphoribosyltransferase [Desulfohalobiaceae bacterium]
MSGMKLNFSKDEIAKRVEELAEEISSEYAEKEESLVVICVLKGAFVFFADLIRKLKIPVEIDFVRIASYGDKMSSNQDLTLTKGIEGDLKNKHVLIVEDIVDTGLTIQDLVSYLWSYDPISVKVCTLIHKIERRMVEAQVDYWGFRIRQGFIVGYGLDYAEKHRQLEGIYEICTNNHMD